MAKKIEMILVDKKELFSLRKDGKNVFVPERDIINSWTIQRMVRLGVLDEKTVPDRLMAFAKDNKSLSSIWTGITRVDISNLDNILKNSDNDCVFTSLEYIGELSILLSKEYDIIDIDNAPTIKEVSEYFAKNFIQPFQPLAVEAILKLIGRMYGKKITIKPTFLGKVQYDLLDLSQDIANLNTTIIKELIKKFQNEKINTPLIQKGIELLQNALLYIEKYQEHIDNISILSDGQYVPSEVWLEKVRNNFIKYWEED